MKEKVYLIFIICLVSVCLASGQSKIKMFAKGSQTTNFNFFTGSQTQNFKTTLKGLGSIGYSYEQPVVSFGNDPLAISIGLGYSVNFYRFEKNLKLTKTDTYIENEIVDNPPYEFKNTFFSWSKNKMVLGYLLVPVGIDIKLHFADIRLEASYARYISGKHKLKYNDPNDTFDNKGKVTLDWMVSDQKEKYKIPNKEFKDYYLNKDNLSTSIEIIPKKSGKRLFGIGFRYNVLPLFIEGKGADIHETSIFVAFYDK